MDQDDVAFLPGRLRDSVETNARSALDRLDMHRLTLEHIFEVVQRFGDNRLTGCERAARDFSNNY
jgi:hypothetical protein